MDKVLDSAAGPFGWIVGVGGGLLVVLALILLFAWVIGQLSKPKPNKQTGSRTRPLRAVE